VKLRDFAAQDEKPVGTGDTKEHTFILSPVSDIHEKEGEYGKYYVAHVPYKVGEGWESRKVSISIPLWITLRDKHDIGVLKAPVQITVRRDASRPREDQYIVKVQEAPKV